MNASGSNQTEGRNVRTVVMLQNIRATTWPVWVSDGVTFDKLDDTPVSETLKKHLLSWTEFYKEHHRGAWESPDSAFAYNSMGLDLANRVADELGPSYRVMVYLDGFKSEGWVEV